MSEYELFQKYTLCVRLFYFPRNKKELNVKSQISLEKALTNNFLKIFTEKKYTSCHFKLASTLQNPNG